MTKRKKENTGRVIIVSKEDNLILKKLFLDYDEVGTSLSNQEICNHLFRVGLYAKVKELDETKTE